MSTRPSISNRTIARCALAAVLAAGAAVPALAQGSDSYRAPGYNYDPCRRDANQRGTAGALIGGGMGAVIGSNAAARNARTEGALLGGLLGAIAGGVVGNKTAACTPQRTAALPPPPPLPPAREPSSYYDRDAYADRAAAEARDDVFDRAQDRADDRATVTERSGPSGDCTLAESPVHMPDGRTQMRFVRVCRDATGRYAVVD